MVTVGKPLGYHSPLDPELAAEGGLTKVAVRSTFTPGTVTVTGSSTNLTSGTATYTTVAIGSTPVQMPAEFSAARAHLPMFKLGATNGTIRYFLDQPAHVAVEILNASGKVVQRAAGARQDRGWHPVQLTNKSSSGHSAVSGVYIVRCIVDGNMFMKRVFVLR